MKRNIITTADGSTTIQLEGWDEQYHSKHGAIQEARHVFLQNGLQLIKDDKVCILEMGFGTGLNALLTLLYAQARHLKIDYVGIDAHPVPKEEVVQLNYIDQLNATEQKKAFAQMHAAKWSTTNHIATNFTLIKIAVDFRNVAYKNRFHLIYYDAFGPRVQPELWTEHMFTTMFAALLPGGILTTYSAKGSVRRAMQQVGFSVKKVPGPPGKREMLVAQKLL